MTSVHTDLEKEITLQIRAPKLNFFHEIKVALKEFYCVPPPSSASANDTSATTTFRAPTDAEFLFCLLTQVNETFLDNDDVLNLQCHAGLHTAIQDYLDSYELIYRTESGADTSGCKSTFTGDHRTLYALFRHKPNGQSSYYRHTFFASILADITTYSGNP